MDTIQLITAEDHIGPQKTIDDRVVYHIGPQMIPQRTTEATADGHRRQTSHSMLQNGKWEI